MNDHIAQDLDIAVTVLDVVNMEIPERMQGKSMVSLLNGENPQDWRDAVYYHYYEGPDVGGGWHSVARHYGVRTNRYTLVHYPAYVEWELFDLETDPEQIQSVYGEPEYAEIQQELKNRIDELQDQYEDDTWDK